MDYVEMIKQFHDDTVMNTFFVASKDDDTKRKAIIAALFALDREVEAKYSSEVASSWDTLNQACQSAPSATFNPLQKVGATAESMKKLYSSIPEPSSQMFIEAPLPETKDILEAVNDPSKAASPSEPSTANAVVKSFLLEYFGLPMGPIDEKILDCLLSIQSETLPTTNPYGRQGFEIVFKFDTQRAKKFFRNPDLRLAVLFGEPARWNAYSAAEEVRATKIDWVVDPTVQRMELPPTVPSRKRDRNDKKAPPAPAAPQFVEVKQPSFFHLFQSFSMMDGPKQQQKQPQQGPEHEGEGDDDGVEVNSMDDTTLERQVQGQHHVLTKLVEFHTHVAFSPFAALKLMTPDDDDQQIMADVLLDEVMGGDEDGDMGSDDSGLMEEGEDFDEDESEDDEPPLPPPKKKKAAPSEQKQQQQQGQGKKEPPKDCKQQ